MLDEAVLSDPVRLAAVWRARRDLPIRPIPLDAISRLAARLLNAPMAAVTLVGSDEEFFAGSHGMPQALTSPGRAPLEYSVCKYVVTQDHPVSCGDMSHDAELRGHLLAAEYGVRAFLGVPVRDAADRALGSLTALDTTARQWTDDELATLLEIAELLRPPEPAAPAAPLGTLDTEALLDSVQEAFLAVRPDGTVAGFNRAAEDLLGFDAAQVQNRHLDDHLLPDYDGQPIGAALARLFAAGPRRPVTRQVGVRRSDGQRLTCRASLSVVRGAEGPLACVFLTDLSQQVAAEDRADRNGSFLSALLDSLTVGVVACDHTGRVVVLNRVLRDLQGLPPAAPLPANYPATLTGALRHADMRRMLWRDTPLMRAFHGEPAGTVDVLIAAPGKPVRTFATTALPMIARDGRRLGAVAVAHEMTEIRRAERFRACHLAVEEALRTAATPAGAVPGVLRAVTAALGWPCAELFLIDEVTGRLRPAGHWDAEGHAADGFFGHVPVRGAGVVGRVWASRRARWIADLATYPELSDDERAWQRRGIRSVLAVPILDARNLLGVLVCHADVPEERGELLTVLLDGVAAQVGVHVALRRAEQASRELTRAQDDLIALVGHELRTPLTAISANVTMLDEDSANLDADQRQMLRAVARNTAALLDVVDKLLDLAGLESGYLGLDVAQLDLAGIVTAAVAAARQSAVETGVLISAELPARLDIVGDARRLRQVIDDVLSNAVRYSPLGGRVRIELGTDGAMATLCILDTGIGTPAQERDRVFDRFFRGSNVRHQGTTGSGLGLSLARAIVRRHGGEIRLAPNQPTGTVACVRLPMTAVS